MTKLSMLNYFYILLTIYSYFLETKKKYWGLTALNIGYKIEKLANPGKIMCYPSYA